MWILLYRSGGTCKKPGKSWERSQPHCSTVKPHPSVSSTRGRSCGRTAGPTAEDCRGTVALPNRVQVFSLEEEKAEQGPEGVFLIKKAGTEYKSSSHAGAAETPT